MHSCGFLPVCLTYQDSISVERLPGSQIGHIHFDRLEGIIPFNWNSSPLPHSTQYFVHHRCRKVWEVRLRLRSMLMDLTLLFLRFKEAEGCCQSWELAPTSRADHSHSCTWKKRNLIADCSLGWVNVLSGRPWGQRASIWCSTWLYS